MPILYHRGDQAPAEVDQRIGKTGDDNDFHAISCCTGSVLSDACANLFRRLTAHPVRDRGLGSS
jgi:hypothetical protein